MSIYYTVKEHLVIEDTEKHSDIVDLTVNHLSLMGASLLMDCGNFSELTAIADGAEYVFSGSTVTENYHKLITAIRDASHIEIIASFGYWYYAFSVDPGPFAMVDRLQELAKNDPEQLTGMFYSMYNNADCDATAGTLIGFGEKNGQIYTGCMDLISVDCIPDGDWHTPLTALCFDSDDLEGKDCSAIVDVCTKLCAFSSKDELSYDDHSISFYLNNLQINSDAQLKAFMALTAELIDLTDGECSLIGELVDTHSPDARILHFDVEYNGSYTLKMAALNG